MLVWFLTRLEVIAALARRARESSLTPTELHKSKEQPAVLEQGWSEGIATERVRDRAYRLLENDPLRAADSLQLAAALIASEDNPQGLGFVTFDQRLGAAAEKEGFTVLGGYV
jgi:predicted nucleic acid-binding protein